MPLYTYRCPACGFREMKFRTIERRNERVSCAILHPEAEMLREIEAPSVKGDYPGYSCPVTGAWIEGRRAHEENLKRQGARVLEPGETQGYIRAREKEEEQFYSSVGETIDREIATLPAPKREQLAVEMEKGLDTSYNRATGKGAQ